MTVALMVQGTTSDAGKTVMVAGLCRLLMRRGVNVAPFKPQNMALNSAVTPEGGEIGRAQALQAQACGIAPHVDMNPVLLKPSSDTGAQVILQGKALSQMEAASFHDYKKVAMNTVLDSWKNLSGRYEALIVEGAGSPAEINLRENDIANMGFAEAVDCPVVIVADIDRGGVFAHLTGTLDLLSESEQKRVSGFIINRFRGDIALLQPGLDWLEERTGKPVLGVIPYLERLKLDSEDTVATQQTLESGKAVLNVVVPVLDRISNTTDFDALRSHPRVNLQMVSPKELVPPADLIILPGSKNVRADLSMLKANGWQHILETHIRYGGKVLGLCGGYQMLGKTIDDPEGVEDNAGQETGFSLLDVSTTLTEQKDMQNKVGTLLLAQKAKCIGYEIHCGFSSGPDLECPLIDYGNSKKEGALSDDNKIAGTYLHGVFDEPAAADLLLAWAGLSEGSAIDLSQQRETELDRLASCLETHLSGDFLQSLMPQQELNIQIKQEKNNV